MAKKAARAPDPVDDDLSSGDSIATADPPPDPKPAGGDDAGTSGGDTSEGGEPPAAEPDAAASPENAFARWMASTHGLNDLAEMDDAAAAGELARRYQEAGQYQEQLSQMQRQAAYWQYMAQQAQQIRQPPPVSQPQAGGDKKKWQAPDYSPDWLRLVTRDESGNYVPVNGAAPDLPQKLLAWADHVQKQQQSLFSNPTEWFKQAGLDDVISEAINQRLGEHAVGMRQEQIASDIWAKNAHWMQSKGADGRPAIDQATGLPALTADGQAALRYMKRLLRAGTHDFAEVFEFAKRSVASDLQAQMLVHGQQAKAADPNAAQALKNAEFLRKQATKRGQQTGSQPQPQFNGQPPQNNQLPFGAMLAQNFRKAGLMQDESF